MRYICCFAYVVCWVCITCCCVCILVFLCFVVSGFFGSICGFVFFIVVFLWYLFGCDIGVSVLVLCWILCLLELYVCFGLRCGQLGLSVCSFVLLLVGCFCWCCCSSLSFGFVYIMSCWCLVVFVFVCVVVCVNVCLIWYGCFVFLGLCVSFYFVGCLGFLFFTFVISFFVFIRFVWFCFSFYLFRFMLVCVFVCLLILCCIPFTCEFVDGLVYIVFLMYVF